MYTGRREVQLTPRSPRSCSVFSFPCGQSDVQVNGRQCHPKAVLRCLFSEAEEHLVPGLQVALVYLAVRHLV